MRNYPKPSWKLRRRIIHSVLIFCAFCVLWIMIRDQEGSVSEMIVISCFGLAGSIIASYIFGAVWDDKNYMYTLKPKQKEIDPDTWKPPSDEELG